MSVDLHVSTCAHLHPSTCPCTRVQPCRPPCGVVCMRSAPRVYTFPPLLPRAIISSQLPLAIICSLFVPTFRRRRLRIGGHRHARRQGSTACVCVHACVRACVRACVCYPQPAQRHIGTPSIQNVCVLVGLALTAPPHHSDTPSTPAPAPPSLPCACPCRYAAAAVSLHRQPQRHNVAAQPRRCSPVPSRHPSTLHRHVGCGYAGTGTAPSIVP
jgi:hypothetical protein